MMIDDDNDIREPWGPKASRHLSYRWGKTPKKPHPGNLFRPGIKPRSAAWQARMLSPGPQRWTWDYLFTVLQYSLLASQLKLVQIDVSTVKRCTSIDEGRRRVACRDLSCDDNTLFIAREGMLQTYKKHTVSLFFTGDIFHYYSGAHLTLYPKF